MDLEKVKSITQELLADVGFGDVEVVVTQANGEGGDETTRTIISLAGEDLGILIGRRGETLNALQRVLSLLIQSNFGEWTYVTLNAGGYREERAEYLKEMLYRATDKARFLSEAVPLPPMSAYERRVLHTLVSEIDDIDSSSDGEGYHRHVIVKPL